MFACLRIAKTACWMVMRQALTMVDQVLDPVAVKGQRLPSTLVEPLHHHRSQSFQAMLIPTNHPLHPPVLPQLSLALLLRSLLHCQWHRQGEMFQSLGLQEDRLLRVLFSIHKDQALHRPIRSSSNQASCLELPQIPSQRWG